MDDKLKEIFGESPNISNGVSVIVNPNSEGHFVKVGVDANGEDIIVNTNPRGGLQLSQDILEKINDPEWLDHNRNAERNRRKQLLNKWFKSSSTGPLADDFDRSRELFEIPKEFVHLLSNEEDDDEELDARSRKIIKDARKKASVVEPDFMKGLVNSLDAATGYKNMAHVVDFMKYLKLSNINFKALKNDMKATTMLFEQWKAERRPSIPVIMQKLIQEADELFFNWLKTDTHLDDEAKHILKTNIASRVEFLREMELESGKKLYEMDDFIIQKFQFQEYGLHKEDIEWFDHNKMIPNQTGVTMGNYLAEFEARTGFKYEDIYYHFWKEVEKENLEKEKNEAIGESFDRISLSEDRPNEEQFISGDKPELSDTVVVKEELYYDEDDII